MEYPGSNFVTVAMDKVVFKKSVREGAILKFIVEKITEGTTSVRYVVRVFHGNSRKENDMTDKELYQQKKQAQLDQWKAEVAKLKAKASEASADAQLELNKQIDALEGKLAEGRTKLAEIADASEDAWESIKDGAESAWDSLKSAFSDAAAKFKK